MQILFAQLITWLAQYFSKATLHAAYKIAVTLSFIGLSLASLNAYYQGAKATLNLMASSVPDVVAGVWGWVMPPNTTACFMAMISATLLRFFSNQYRLLLNHKFMAAISN